MVPNPDKANWSKGKPARHRMILETFKHGFVVRAHVWATELEWLFDLRDAAVHHQETWSDPEPHATGTNVSRENASYRAESASRAVDLLLDVFNLLVAKPKAIPGVQEWSRGLMHVPAVFESARHDGTAV